LLWRRAEIKKGLIEGEGETRDGVEVVAKGEAEHSTTQNENVILKDNDGDARELEVMKGIRGGRNDREAAPRAQREIKGEARVVDRGRHSSQNPNLSFLRPTRVRESRQRSTTISISRGIRQKEPLPGVAIQHPEIVHELFVCIHATKHKEKGPIRGGRMRETWTRTLIELSGR